MRPWNPRPLMGGNKKGFGLAVQFVMSPFVQELSEGILCCQVEWEETGRGKRRPIMVRGIPVVPVRVLGKRTLTLGIHQENVHPFNIPKPTTRMADNV